MFSVVNENPLRLAFGVHNKAKDAPAKLLRSIDSEAQALAVSMLAAGCKLSYVAACIGKTEAYVSMMRSGVRPIPEKLVRPLCAATGSNLLAQFRALQVALDEADDRREIERLATILREAA